MGCDYYIEIYLEIIFFDPKKDWKYNSTDAFHDILNKDKRLYKDLKNTISKYFLDENYSTITLETKRGYLFDFPEGKTYNEILEENLKVLYKPRKIYEYGIGWDFKEYFWDWNEKNIDYINERLKNVLIYREKSGHEYISIPQENLIEIWIKEYRYERT